MPLTLELAPEEESRLEERAQAAGLTVEEFAKRTLLETPAQMERRLKRERGMALLQSWIDEANAATDEEREVADKEWRETMRALDEDRGSSRKIFGSILDDQQ
jgi:DNA mismatch repair protein MutH